MATKQNYQKRNKALGAIVAVLLVIVMCASVVLGVGFGVYGKNTDDWFKKQNADQGQEQPEQPEQPSDEEQVESEAKIMLFAGETMLAANNTVSKTLTATVLPADAPNKKVDWSVSWASDAPLKDKAIGDYLTVTPASDGALTATVTCKKSFRGSVAYVKVVTREGKFEATSMITFDGIPSSLTVDTSSLNKYTIQGLSNSYAIKVGSTALSIDLTNVFGDVGETFYENLSVSVSAVGSIKVDGYTQGRGGSAWSNTEKNITIESIGADKFINATVSGKKLLIEGKKTVESYYESVNGNASGNVYTNKFKSLLAMQGGTYPHFNISVACGELSHILSVWVVSSVSSVSVTPSVSF